MCSRYAGVLVLAAFATLAAGCSYTSQYRAPADGRARVIWREDRPIAVLPGGNAACESAALQAIQTPAPGAAPRATVGVTPTADVHFVYVRAVHHPHHHPRVAPPAAAPRFHAAAVAGGGHDAAAAGHAATAAGGGSVAHGAAAASSPAGHGAAPASAGAGAGAGSASAPLKSGGSPPKVNPSDGPPELWVVAAVVALVSLPVITLALVGTDPMPHADAAAAVDLANAYNDLARTPGTACGPPVPPPLEPAQAAESAPAPPSEGLQPAAAAEGTP